MKRKSRLLILLGVMVMGVRFYQDPEVANTTGVVGIWIVMVGIVGLTWAWATTPSCGGSKGDLDGKKR